MSIEIIDFKASDGLILDGYIDKCDKNNNQVLIQIHGMTSNCFKKRDRIIAQKIKQIGIDTICFNNRGGEIVRNINHEDGIKKIGGSAFEDIEDSYYDIIGAIDYAISRGYKSIYLQGHSLGSTKLVFTYNKMKQKVDERLKYIKGIILLSLVDIPSMINKHLNKQIKEYILHKEQTGNLMEILQTDSFMKLISVKTILRYMKYNENIDFARYSERDYDFEKLNNIEIPTFMRWGNKNEMIDQPADELIKLIKEKVNGENKNIDFIEGADHSYNNREDILAQQILDFLQYID